MFDYHPTKLFYGKILNSNDIMGMSTLDMFKLFKIGSVYIEGYRLIVNFKKLKALVLSERDKLYTIKIGMPSILFELTFDQVSQICDSVPSNVFDYSYYIINSH